MKNELNNENVKLREDDDRYPIFEQAVKDHFTMLVNKDTALFSTDAENLWEVYLNNLPENEGRGRQHYNCSACRHFIQRYGNLVTINEDGEIESVLWTEDAPTFFKQSAMELRKAVSKSKINRVFVSDNRILGTPKTSIWSHLSATLPTEKVNRSRVKTAGQIMADKLEDYRILNGALQEYSIDIVNQAFELLKTETLYRSEKCLGVAKWFKELHEKVLSSKNEKIKENIIWFFVATAPNGFCHIKSSMIGTLLDDIASGMDFESVSRRFAEKMNPANYMRSQVAPTKGNIEQAEKIVEKMGIVNSLKRRYATFEEIPNLLWKNNYKAKEEQTIKKTGVFSNVIPKIKAVNFSNTNLPTTIMTWEKFQRTILKDAENIEVKVDNTNRLMALVTASDKDAENILQWNNTFSWYYHGGIDGEIRRRLMEAGARYENNEIRCSLIWEGGTDLDIHCITPDGYHIYYRDKRDRYNGYLDVDANGGRVTSMSPVENIRWAENAPKGHYKFYVHNYCERGRGTTPFKVELEVNGNINTYNGVAGGKNYQTTVFEFDYVNGKAINLVGGDLASTVTQDWNISNEFTKVNGITFSPNLWEEKQVTHSGSHVFFILDGCKDISEGKGRGFFNEMLKSELHEVRKTLEAYTANTPIEAVDKASACGVGFTKDSDWNLTLKVTSNNSQRLIKIDRWD